MQRVSLLSAQGIASLSAVGAAGLLGGFYLGKIKNDSATKNLEPFGAKNSQIRDNSLVPYDPKLVQVPARAQEIMKYGIPSLNEVRSFDDFILSYDRRTRIANWVFEHLTADRLRVSDNVDRSKCQFMEDPVVHPYFRSTNQDYKGSGFDRGHLAAAGNHRLKQEHCNQTFYLTNISPQVGDGFNRHAWNRLEKYVRGLTRTYPNVYVVTGPLFLPKLEGDGKWYVKYQVIGPNKVAVPTHFFKVLVMETNNGEFHLESYLMPNQAIEDKTPITSFLVPPEVIEKYSGLLFFDQLSRRKLTQVNKMKSTTV